MEVREARALGSRLRLVSCSPAGIEAAWTAVRAEFAAVDAAMSRFRADSEITRINRAGGRAGSVSGRLRTALVLADRARRLTAGRFDPRVLRDMERLGFAAAPLGDGGATGSRDVRDTNRRIAVVDEDRFQLSGPVDLGGIGKGLALRWSAAAVQRHLGGSGFLIDAGGDITTRGEAALSPMDGWSIAVEDPLGAEQPIAVCRLASGQSIATSSVRVARHPGIHGDVHHLVDPRTGGPGGDGLLAVTVAWDDPAWAEVWSKALFLAGAAGIADEARRRGLAAWWVEADGTLRMTPAARAVTTWVRDEIGRPWSQGRRVSLP